jgi:hypothetical protein
MDRITKRDLAGMLARLQRNAHTHGIITTDQGLTLEPGSATFGNSYQVWSRWTTEGTNGLRDGQPFGTFHFGFTARDAYDRMHAMCAALEAATYGARS